MKVKGYLLVSQDGTDTKFLKTAAHVQRGQLAIPLDIDIPDVLFYPPKLPTVVVTIDEAALPHLRVINEHCEALQDAGVKIRLVEAGGKT